MDGEGVLLREDAEVWPASVKNWANEYYVLSVTYVPFETAKQYTAYAPDKHPEAETVKIKIYSDMK